MWFSHWTGQQLGLDRCRYKIWLPCHRRSKYRHSWKNMIWALGLLVDLKPELHGLQDWLVILQAALVARCYLFTSYSRHNAIWEFRHWSTRLARKPFFRTALGDAKLVMFMSFCLHRTKSVCNAVAILHVPVLLYESSTMSIAVDYGAIHFFFTLRARVLRGELPLDLSYGLRR